jgi:hypothetical protein
VTRASSQSQSQGGTARAGAALDGGRVRLSLRGIDQDVSDVQRGERHQDAVVQAWGSPARLERADALQPYDSGCELNTTAATAYHAVSHSPCLRPG